MNKKVPMPLQTVSSSYIKSMGENLKTDREAFVEEILSRFSSVLNELQDPNTNESLEELRSVSSKLLAKMTSKTSLKENSELIFRDETITMILKLLTTCNDIKVQSNIILLLSECLNLKGPNKHYYLQCLVKNDASAVLLTCLKNFQISDSTSYATALHSTIAKVGAKDPTFAVSARKAGVVKITFQLLKMAGQSFNSTSPFLRVIKLYCKSAKNRQILCREGFMNYILSLLRKTNKRLSSANKLTLELLTLLSLSKCCCHSLIKNDGVAVLLSLLDGWKHIDPKVCGYLLSCLVYITRSKLGRKTLALQGGGHIIYRFFSKVPNAEKFDPLLVKACTVLHSCHPKPVLPVSGPSFTFTYKGRDLQESVYPCEHISSDSEEEEFDDELSDCASEDGLETNNPIGTASNLLNVESATHRAFISEVLPGAVNPTMASNMERLNLASVVMTSDEEGKGQLTFPEVYHRISKRTNSIISFVKYTFADSSDARSPINIPEPLLEHNREFVRERLLATVESVMNPSEDSYKFIYDLDMLKDDPLTDFLRHDLNNNDKHYMGRMDVSDLVCSDHLKFESRFESGNLRKVSRTGPREYQLILNPDVNSSRNFQWFYFQVANMDGHVPYTFNIINLEKKNSQYNQGMQPVMFSVIEAVQGRSGWVRTGSDICYYRNEYTREIQHECRPKSFFTVSFKITFPHSYDLCYIAYHYPYTYTGLMTDLYFLAKETNYSKINFRMDSYCTSVNGNPIPLLTITSPTNMDNKEFVVLTCRVHPGETNSSWIMKGIIEFLLSEELVAEELRKLFIFKIVPMLNVDGVINGCHRCGLTGEDLNRRWKDPDPIQNPEIYHIKCIIAQICRYSKAPPYLYCDFHGHSNRKNVFLFGCDKAKSWYKEDLNDSSDAEFYKFAKAMKLVCPYFSLKDCNFTVRKNRESTARVSVWRDFNIPMSYTLETSYCGCDVGHHVNNHLTTHNLMEIGQQFCQALALLKDPHTVYTLDPTPSVTESSSESQKENNDSEMMD